MNKLKSMNLEQAWYIAKDPDNIGKKEGWERAVQKEAVTAYVPSIIQQFFPEYHGAAYYWCKFSPVVSLDASERAVLRFGGADYLAEVWLNSVYLGSYEGGETPFSFDVTTSLKANEENLLAVRIINPCDRDIDGMNIYNTPHRNKTIKKRAGSGLNNGGLWYGVTLSALPAVYVEDTFLEGDIHSGVISVMLKTHSNLEQGCMATLYASVCEKNIAGQKKAETKISLDIAKGSCEHSFRITLSDHKLWSVDDPHLYTVTLSLATIYGCYTVSLPFGFREFIIKDGFFYLNGKRILLKSSHSGNAFPVGQMLPVHGDQLRRDFVYAKACGFNTLRAIAGLFRPEQLELADEIGLLIYEECYASWCLGESEQYDWASEEEFTAIMRKEHPDVTIGDERTMLSRWIHATENMIRRDRNHPSVVIWGLLNETKNNGVFRTARDFLPRLRELDPTRVVVLSSARWDYDLTIGSASNPHSNVWENTWGPDGRPALWDKDQPARTIGDNHYYPTVPIASDGVETLRTMGSKTPLPFFLSESGVGSNFHVIEEWKHFLQYGYRKDLEDASWLQAQSDAFTKDFYDYGMETLFPFPDSFLKESQRMNADERKRFFDIVRSNPRLAGYSLTGLLDHGMCGEGLWSYWRRWKPGMFDAVSDGWTPLRFCLFATPCSYRGEEIVIEAVLANESVLGDGSYTADFAIESENGVIMRFTEAFSLRKDDFATPIFKKNVRLDLPRGKYRLVANLREGVAAADATDFFVFERCSVIVPTLPVYALDLGERAYEALNQTVPSLKAYGGEKDGLILAGKITPEKTEALLAAAHVGASVVFLDASIFDEEENARAIRAVDAGLTVKHYLDWLYHKDYALLSRELFDGIDGRLARLTMFGSVFANTSFNVGRLPEHVFCPGFLTGYYGVDGGYTATHALVGYRHGEGWVYLNAWNLLPTMGYPIADKILHNLIAMLSKNGNRE